MSRLAVKRASLEDEWFSPSFRLVLPRDKRDRLNAHLAAVGQRRTCTVPGCGGEGLPVVLIEAEQEAMLCGVHRLVLLDGSPVEGEPLLAMSMW
ncbi:MAG: hypothetical protein JO352_31790 [Chloroflexi bacterium]|nr:hypothetical protein [Chloroflexota bacterium]MBV9603205.1 hypothetical protein [Chloroflexota bacterium]